MRLKPVPPAPEDLDRLWAARRGVPLVPGSEDDCCARIRDRLGLAGRDEARTWLTFLRALDLAEETSTGYARTREEVDPAALARRFESGVFAAREVLDAVAADDQPVGLDAVFEAVEGVVPRWERQKGPGWRDRWRERVARILAWAALLGLVERVDGGYRATDGR
jgi:hypothetical protein